MKYYELLGYWGAVELRVELKGIEDCYFYRPSQSTSTPRADSLDPDITFSAVINAGSLKEEKPSLVLKAAQQVAWAFGWVLDEAELDQFYVQNKREPVISLLKN